MPEQQVKQLGHHVQGGFRPHKRPWRIKNLTGQLFGRLTATVCLGMGVKGRQTFWECICKCGNKTVVASCALLSENTTSCGCLREESLRANRTTHGQTETKEYGIWSAMKSRCYRTTDPDYPSYGGRGITVCLRWTDSFQAFIDDMGPRPSSKLSIDRYPNNNGNYEPGNCRWATATQQARNKRNSHFLTHDGQTLTIAEWAVLKGHKSGSIISGRLRKGWSVASAIDTPAIKR